MSRALPLTQRVLFKPSKLGKGDITFQRPEWQRRVGATGHVAGLSRYVRVVRVKRESAWATENLAKRQQPFLSGITTKLTLLPCAFATMRMVN